jgi:hypothetical protein
MVEGFNHINGDWSRAVFAFQCYLDNVMGTGDCDQHIMFTGFARDAVRKVCAGFDFDPIGP